MLAGIAAGFGLDVPDEATARAAVEADFAEGQRLRIDIDDVELKQFIDRALQ